MFYINMRVLLIIEKPKEEKNLQVVTLVTKQTG